MNDFDDGRFDGEDVAAIAQAAMKGLIMGLLVVLALMMAGCSTTEVAEAEQESRFEIESLYYGLTVITDTKEGCQYLFYRRGHAAGMEQLTDKYGNPLLADGYSRNEVGMSNDDEE